MTGQIERHRTAQRRSALSSPMQHLLRFGFLDGSRSLFDYGCGRGDDLRLLTELNVPASGWDPVFRPDAGRQSADIVNLVLGYQSKGEQFDAHEDGVRAQRNTFQTGAC